MTAPTEAEIREAIHQRGQGDSSGLAPGPLLNVLRHVASDYAQAYSEAAYAAKDEDLTPVDGDTGLWSDLRHSEAGRLLELVDEACHTAALQAEAAIVQALVNAALDFAEEYPDAPRGTYGKPQLIPA